MHDRQALFWPTDSVPKRIIFHDDFDGICSAAILRNYFGSKQELEPIQYSVSKHWLARRLHNAAVVDFLFHPEAMWWFDHHNTTFQSSALELQYIPSSRRRWDPTYPSCPGLILDVLSESLDVSILRSRFRIWIHWADKIDSAQYQSAYEAILGENPCIQINQALAASNSRELRTRLVELIASAMTPTKVANDSEISILSEQFRRSQKQALEQISSKMFERERVGFCDILSSSTPYVRYGAFALSPSLIYSITLYQVSTGRMPYKLAVSRNPWATPDTRRYNLGELLSIYGGGGRVDVGAALFKTMKECRESGSNIFSKLTARQSRSG